MCIVRIYIYRLDLLDLSAVEDLNAGDVDIVSYVCRVKFETPINNLGIITQRIL